MDSKQSKHTQGQWTAHDDDGTGTLPCVLADTVTAYGNFYVAKCNVFEDAKRIVQCVNAHDDLVAALDRILRAHDSRNNGAVMGEANLCAEFAARARAALAKATGA